MLPCTPTRQPPHLAFGRPAPTDLTGAPSAGPPPDWSRREDIQARTVRGRLSWTGRKYLAGTSHIRMLSLQAGTEIDSSWVTSSMQTSSKISLEENQLAQDQFCGELNGERTGKLVKDKPDWEQLQTKRGADAEVSQEQIKDEEQPAWQRNQLKDQIQTNQSGQEKQFEQSRRPN
ncbi:carotene epsilon-monooxygenase, chloroplastic [Dorcoceras hygrometricum]|uniref:Carotene epsilon-monooxygenase, chloroplastic n=1 Tax=Dorcoceras hygrometricum TaxID=472368 RepID=A0A2Z7BMZ4_9LAMI|nr:carotene epsilon-monooxygenase, chloroplastic [Dorcoceras hygrometricum]